MHEDISYRAVDSFSEENKYQVVTNQGNRKGGAIVVDKLGYTFTYRNRNRYVSFFSHGIKCTLYKPIEIQGF